MSREELFTSMGTLAMQDKSNQPTLPSSPFCIGVPVTHHLCTLLKCSATSAAFKIQNIINNRSITIIILLITVFKYNP